MRITWLVAMLVLLACGSSVEKRGASGDPSASPGDGGAAPEPSAGGEEASRQSLRAQYCLQCLHSPYPPTPHSLDMCLGEDNDCFFATMTTAWLDAMVVCECDADCARATLAKEPASASFSSFVQACDAVCNGPSDVCSDMEQWPNALIDEAYDEWTACLEESTCADAFWCRHELCPL